MDVRLKSNVVSKGAVLVTGTALSLSEKEAQEWIERGLAEKVESVQSDTTKETTEVVKTTNTSSKKRAKK